jgi:hypothetical protein
MIGFAAFAGLISGPIYVAALRFSLPIPNWALSLLIQIGTPVAMGTAFSALVAVVVRRRASVALLSVVFWIAMALAAGFVFEVRHASEAGYDADLTSRRWWISEAIFILVASVVGGLLGLLTAFVSRMWMTPQEQDGLWCWRCAYRVGEGAITVCPECGTPVNPSRFRYHLIHRMVTFGRRIGWVGVVLASLPMLSLLATNNTGGGTSATVRYNLEKHGKAEGAFFCVPGSSPLSAGPACEGVRIPLSPPASLDLIAAYRSVPRAGEPIVQLQVSQVLSRGSAILGLGASMTSSLPIPRVLCDLNEKQAAYILEKGVPPSLKSAMLAASTGGTVGWMGSAPPPPDIRIDPTLHFPP